MNETKTNDSEQQKTAQPQTKTAPNTAQSEEAKKILEKMQAKKDEEGCVFC